MLAPAMIADDRRATRRPMIADDGSRAYWRATGRSVIADDLDHHARQGRCDDDRRR